MSEEQTPVSREVRAGDQTYTIRKFMGYKAFRIGRMLTGLGEIGPAISKKVNEYTAEYRANNADKISRATLEFRYPQDAAMVSDEAWKESGGFIELPNDPSQGELMAVILPTAFDLAGDKVADLLAWVVADDSALEAKDNEGEEAVSQYIEGLRRELLFKCGIDELLDLGYAAQDILRDQLAGKADQARSLLKLVGLDPDPEETEDEGEPTDDGPEAASPVIEDEEKIETPSTPQSSTTSEKPGSSIDSPEPTAGIDDPSSIEPVGAPSASISG